jgi:hypothetical protein
MDGDASYREVNNNLQTISSLRFNNLSIRSIVGSADVNFRATRWFALFGGFHTSARRVQSSEGFATTASTEVTRFSQTNRLNSGLAGIRLQPNKPVSFVFDAEIGRTNTPFFPISERNYHALGARAQYKSRVLTLSASARTFHNTNSVTLSEHSSRSRNYTADASWTPRSWFALDAGYAKLHLDTLTGLAFFASNQLVTGERSYYVSNVHSTNCGLRFVVRDRLTVYLGYSRVQDLGDGREVATITPAGSSSATLADFRAAQTFPLAYQSPLGRLSVRLHDKVRWNIGYQHYQYREDFAAFCRLSPVVGLPDAGTSSTSACPVSGNYRAHTGFTSMIWSF